MDHIAELSRYLIPAVWLIWVIVWLGAARGTKRTRWRDPIASRLVYAVPANVAVLLLVWPSVVPLLRARFVVAGPLLPALGTLLVATGIGIAFWARWHLGGNWSGIITIKLGHSLTRTGPYRWVRHPIYSGLLLAVLGTALAIGEWRGLVALGLMAGSFLYKLALEEGRMRETFPEYDDYRRHSWALVPPVF